MLSSQAVAMDAATIYQQNCAKCHGIDGKGQTTVGKKLHVPDMTLPDWQAKYSAVKIRETIENGVQDKTGRDIMKAYKEKLSPEEIDALVPYVQKFGLTP